MMFYRGDTKMRRKMGKNNLRALVPSWQEITFDNLLKNLQSTFSFFLLIARPLHE